MNPNDPTFSNLSDTPEEIQSEDFQFVLKALLAAYEPVLREDIHRLENPEELNKEAQSHPRCRTGRGYRPAAGDSGES